MMKNKLINYIEENIKDLKVFIEDRAKDYDVKYEVEDLYDLDMDKDIHAFMSPEDWGNHNFDMGMLIAYNNVLKQLKDE